MLFFFPFGLPQGISSEPHPCSEKVWFLSNKTLNKKTNISKKTKRNETKPTCALYHKLRQKQGTKIKKKKTILKPEINGRTTLSYTVQYLILCPKQRSKGFSIGIREDGRKPRPSALYSDGKKRETKPLNRNSFFW